MKKLISLLTFMLATFLTSAQDKSLVGTWNIVECSYLNRGEKQQIMADEIKSGTAVTDYEFTSDGKYKLTSNMSGSGTMDTYEGTWNTADSLLKMTLTIENQSMEIVWNYVLKDNKLILSRTSPDGTMKILNSFMKKL